MRIVGCLTWYEESLNMLAASIASASRFLDHLVAVDGAYALFPGGRARSGRQQQEMVLSVAQACGLGVTLHVPSEPWWGNEVEKRSRALALGANVADASCDWLYLFDADDVVTALPFDLHHRLQVTDLDVAEVTVWEGRDPDHPAEQFVEGASASSSHVRKFYRALPGLRCEGAHYVYVAEKDGNTVYLWPPADRRELGVPVLDLTDFRVEHHQRLRTAGRNGAARDYYRARDLAGAEALA